VVGYGVFNPVSLTILGNYLYWVDTAKEAVERVQKTSRSSVNARQTSLGGGVNDENAMTIISRLKNLTDVVGVELLPNKWLEASPCRAGANRCSHLCLVDFAMAAEYIRGTDAVGLVSSKKRPFWNHRCACPRGLMLDSYGVTCVPIVPCRADFFACSSGVCIPQVG
jgi:hypothetical protein